MGNSTIEKVEEYKKMYRKGLRSQLIGLVIGAIVGLIFGISGVQSGEFSVSMCVFIVYEFTGIGLGWKTVNNITNKLFGNLAIVGTIWFWVIALFIKLCIAACIGIFELPVFIIKTIYEYRKFMKDADSIVAQEQQKQET